ncbi:hypothetical protein ACFVAV_35475 [Nocardia sp. NPDC057663]|uniref:hypothetical protein n=1 Tax=Nocardia sp. NPDC057663 TaxID=3346201 RepID=UPI00366C980D
MNSEKALSGGAVTGWLAGVAIASLGLAFLARWLYGFPILPAWLVAFLIYPLIGHLVVRLCLFLAAIDSRIYKSSEGREFNEDDPAERALMLVLWPILLVAVLVIVVRIVAWAFFRLFNWQ